MWKRNKEPDDARNSEKYRGEEETVIVSELGDGGGGSEGASGTRDFIEDVLDEVTRLDERAENFEGYVTYDSSVHPP